MDRQQQTETQRKILAVTALALNYGKAMPEAMMDLWLEMLAPYSAEQVERGVMKVMAEYIYKTIPPFAILNRAIEKTSNIVPEEERVQMAAEAEWDHVRTLIRENGWVHPPKNLHPTTAHVLNMFGGWSAVCNWYSDEMQWRKKEFVERWILAHGHEDLMALGAEAVLSGRRVGDAIGAGGSIGSVFGKLTSQEPPVGISQ